MNLLGDNEGDWTCDCAPTFLYHPQTSRCWQAYSRGPCQRNEVLVLQSSKAIPLCERNTCDEGKIKFYNVCSKLESHEACKQSSRESNKLGIHRMMIKGKKSLASAKPKIISNIKPVPALPKQPKMKAAKTKPLPVVKRKPFVLKLKAKSSAKPEELQPNRISYECDACGNTFGSCDELDDHVLTLHGDEDPEDTTITCALCDEEFGSNESLIAHRKVHFSEESVKSTSETAA